MSGQSEAFLTHVKSGLTTLCRAWAVTRKDGTVYGFTDHDLSLTFEGVTFKADTGLSAAALAQSTGLSVDNSEALGALSDASITEEDIEAGRFDGAEVRSWLVNWKDVEERWLQFRGSIGEMRRAGGAFHAELRGLTEALNRPIGRIYQKPCSAVLGDEQCGFDMTTPGYSVDITLESDVEGAVVQFPDSGSFEADWFKRGRLDVLDGAAQGLWAMIKEDRIVDGARVVELWQPVRGALLAGDVVRLSAGCDKRLETCRLKFDNILNYQGFPDLPGEDWVMAYPRAAGANTGGSLR